MRTSRVAVVLSAVAISACASETIVHKLSEKEANRIIELLAEHDIDTTKGMVDTGREVHFSIAVPASKRLDSVKLLNQYELPRRKDHGYVEMFGGEGGLIPTNAEENAKALAALEGELERQLKLVDGILDVQVQLVIPREDALRTTQDQIPLTTASVTVKYMPGAGGAKPLSEPQVQAVVAAGVEKLTPDKVVVVMTPGASPARSPAEAAGGKCVMLGCLTKKVQLAVIIAGIGVFLLLSLGLLYTQLRLGGVRGRLIRLQTEIARARRKPNEGAVVEA